MDDNRGRFLMEELFFVCTTRFGRLLLAARPNVFDVVAFVRVVFLASRIFVSPSSSCSRSRSRSLLLPSSSRGWRARVLRETGALACFWGCFSCRVRPESLSLSPSLSFSLSLTDGREAAAPTMVAADVVGAVTVVGSASLISWPECFGNKYGGAFIIKWDNNRGDGCRQALLDRLRKA